MFAVGVQFSLEELHRVRRVALLGGGLQIGLTILLGTVLGVTLGWRAYADDVMYAEREVAAAIVRPSFERLGLPANRNLGVPSRAT